MKEPSMYHLSQEQYLPVSISEAWDFFSSPGNLARITPPALNFRILTPLTHEELAEGTLIDYHVSPLFNIPLKWRTEILKVNRPYQFTDRQISGPYRVWEHTHYFTETNGKVLMRDEVSYQLPFGILGKLAHRLFVRKKLNEIFEYRKNTIDKIFSANGSH